MSAQPCGCDPAADWLCEQHREQTLDEHLEQRAVEGVAALIAGQGMSAHETLTEAEASIKQPSHMDGIERTKPDNTQHTLTLEFGRFLTQAEWAIIAHEAQSLPFVQNLRADVDSETQAALALVVHQLKPDTKYIFFAPPEFDVDALTRGLAGLVANGSVVIRTPGAETVQIYDIDAREVVAPIEPTAPADETGPTGTFDILRGENPVGGKTDALDQMIARTSGRERQLLENLNPERARQLRARLNPHFGQPSIFIDDARWLLASLDDALSELQNSHTHQRLLQRRLAYIAELTHADGRHFGAWRTCSHGICRMASEFLP